MQKRIIAQGAEAILIREDNILIKERIPKFYRIPAIDQRLRMLRTRQESRIMKKIEFAPRIYDVDEVNMKIVMDYIDEKPLKFFLDEVNNAERKRICVQIGKNIADMHSKDIIHGDLTTNNMILKDDFLYFIDFGLSFISLKPEDKAVDLHVMRQAFEGRHAKIAEECFKYVLEGYQTYLRYSKVLERLEKVEKRGRYKRKTKKQQQHF